MVILYFVVGLVMGTLRSTSRCEPISWKSSSGGEDPTNLSFGLVPEATIEQASLQPDSPAF